MLPYRERGRPGQRRLRCGVLLLQGNIRCSSISAYGSVRLYKKKLRPLAHAPARTAPCRQKISRYGKIRFYYTINYRPALLGLVRKIKPEESI
ncbi:hypothetical protein CLOLEP_01607 [[Clostridium] leptum DSM 753]|uniref:Uncharacterized protein n=1 Tax=[Clostridium] leptum DSM 753 TaxID=428125 RepID=A7VSR6_9FIRM|nr:hypothetical protein CLOLEP_01607 [[Clostridium] leptum DSM 753]